MTNFEVVFCKGYAIPLVGLTLKKKILRWTGATIRTLIERFVGMLYFRGPVCLDPNLVSALRK